MTLTTKSKKDYSCVCLPRSFFSFLFMCRGGGGLHGIALNTQIRTRTHAHARTRTHARTHRTQRRSKKYMYTHAPPASLEDFRFQFCFFSPISADVCAIRFLATFRLFRSISRINQQARPPSTGEGPMLPRPKLLTRKHVRQRRPWSVTSLLPPTTSMTHR